MPNDIVDEIMRRVGDLTHEQTIELLDALLPEFIDEAEFAEAIHRTSFDRDELIEQMEDI